MNTFFLRFDRNNDGRITYEEFKTIMEEKIKSEMITPEDIIGIKYINTKFFLIFYSYH